MKARESKCQISQNDIFLMKFSEFYLCFHNSCELWHTYTRECKLQSVRVLFTFYEKLITKKGKTLNCSSPPPPAKDVDFSALSCLFINFLQHLRFHKRLCTYSFIVGKLYNSLSVINTQIPWDRYRDTRSFEVKWSRGVGGGNSHTKKDGNTRRLAFRV